MSKGKLPNHLRYQRKRLGFSTKEIAFLLGAQHASQVSRYELYQRIPSLEIAIAYHFIFHTAPPELFGGSYERIAKEIRKHAKQLLKKLDPPKGGLKVWKKKVEWLRLLAGENSPAS